MRYSVTRDSSYDFADQSYASAYPNLHRYPATMLPQIGIKLLHDFGCANASRLLDPYCGSGSSFASAIDCGINEVWGYDLNPLAILISKARFTDVPTEELESTRKSLRNGLFEFAKDDSSFGEIDQPVVTNITYWFSDEVVRNLSLLRYFINKIADEGVRNFFTVAFSETVRLCSYTRNNEFKLYRMKEEDRQNFRPDVLSLFFKKLDENIDVFSSVYSPRVKKLSKLVLKNEAFRGKKDYFDVVLTSPPYGDSRTTVAYGQFSTLSNEWLGINSARKIDSLLMGGGGNGISLESEVIFEPIGQIFASGRKRGLEVLRFYNDLAESIDAVAQSVKKGGKVFYVVGNRTVKNVMLPTDQFVAERFEKNNFSHVCTIERLLSGKSMPLRNSPTNKRGRTVNTMLQEYIVVCERN